MTTESITAQLAEEIRDIYARDANNGAIRIEKLLEDRLGGYSEDDRLQIVQRLTSRFHDAAADPIADGNEHMRRIFGVILGREVSSEDLVSGEFLERLAQSLTTIFDSLNQLISVINMSFSGNADSGEETIRQFIGFHLDGGDHTHTLEEYLGQIRTAFMTSHEAFKNAAGVKFGQIIRALDPDEVAKERGSGLKIGPLRKAEDFDILCEKIRRIKKWYESGRFMEDFLREFEKHCERMKLKP